MGQVGYIVFYDVKNIGKNQNKEKKKFDKINKGSPYGSCIYTLCIPFDTTIRKIEDVPVFVELSSIQMQAYTDT